MQAAVIQNHEHWPSWNSTQKYKKHELGGGQAYDRSSI